MRVILGETKDGESDDGWLRMMEWYGMSTPSYTS